MKKWVLISLLTIAVLSIAAFAWSGTVFARNLYNEYGPYGQGMMGGYGYGQGMMGGYGYGMMGGGYGSVMHETMLNEFAEALNLSPEDIVGRIQAGETPWQIAQAEDFTAEQFQQAMLVAHDQALQAAVDAGELTQEQAEWMDQRMESMWSGDYSSFGGCHGANGRNNPESSRFENRYSPMMGDRWGNSF